MLFWVNVIILAFVILYLIGYAIAFCMLFIHFDDCNRKELKKDLVFSLFSWFVVAFVALGWMLEKFDCDTDMSGED